MQKKNSKKSENIEIRISYDVKKNLYERAKTEKRTVSDLVRHLIESYLSQNISSTDQFTIRKVGMFMTNLFKKPKMILASIASAMVISFGFISSASADDYLISVEGKITKMDEAREEVIAARHIHSTLIMDQDGGRINVELNKAHGVVDTDMILQFNFEETVLSSDEKGIKINLNVKKNIEGTQRVVASPTLLVAIGEDAKFITETQEGNTMEFTLKPTVQP